MEATASEKISMQPRDGPAFFQQTFSRGDGVLETDGLERSMGAASFAANLRDPIARFLRSAFSDAIGRRRAIPLP